ncbi:lung adenoma susceptibility protein 2 isoform X3 [Strigops habroptila]|uniref:lung adenoma susceptibility protein 2 isoform X3 n=1 Tax=Strigops habroptila TaxID=2489341 RepID=UPI0011CF54F0|nr:lung adenoma susceptibility protein 2 isoform X3 [Strigops habroptila]
MGLMTMVWGCCWSYGADYNQLTPLSPLSQHLPPFTTRTYSCCISTTSSKVPPRRRKLPATTVPMEERSNYSSASSVSSLLTSCSSSTKAYSEGFIHYKGKLYSSASEALEAYMEDFEAGHTAPYGSTGKIRLQPGIPKGCAKENQELDDFHHYFKLDSPPPPSRSSDEYVPDCTSFTTEELLAFPADGSQPFPHLLPWKSRKTSPESLKTSPCPSQRWDLGRGFHPHNYVSSKKLKGSAEPLVEDSQSFPGGNYPTWLSSQKPDLSVSGISSIPTFPYPSWLKTYNLLCDAAPSLAPGSSGQSQASSSLIPKKGLSNGDNSHFSKPSNSQHSRGDPRGERCNYDFTHGCYSPDNSSLSRTKKLLREPHLPSHFTPGSTSTKPEASMEKEGSPSTTEILRGASPRVEAPAAFKASRCSRIMEDPPAFPKGAMMKEFLESCWNEKQKEEAAVGGHQTRPLEALKLLLFQLQAMEARWKQRTTTEEELGVLRGGEEPGSHVCTMERALLARSVQEALERCLQSLGAEGDHQEAFSSSRR